MLWNFEYLKSDFLSLVTGFMAWTSLLTLVVFCFTIFICIIHSCYGLFKYLCPCNCMVSAISHIRMYDHIEWASRFNVQLFKHLSCCCEPCSWVVQLLSIGLATLHQGSLTFFPLPAPLTKSTWPRLFHIGITDSPGLNYILCHLKHLQHNKQSSKVSSKFEVPLLSSQIWCTLPKSILIREL